MGGTGRAARRSRAAAAWKRRGLLAGVAGLVAGALAVGSDRRAEAGHNSNVGANPLHLGLNNTNDTNTITTVTAGVANGFAFRVDNNGTNGSAIVGESAGTGIAVRGNSSRIGVIGVQATNAPSVPAPSLTAGVTGIGDTVGVRGNSDEVGVAGEATGQSTSRRGVQGVINGSPSVSTVGVLGVANNGGAAVRGISGGGAILGATILNIGVDGLASQAGGIGVRGDGGDVGVKGSSQKIGVRGDGVTAADAVGVRGEAPGTGVFGTSAGGGGVAGTSTSGIGVFGSTTSGTAGLFVGAVLVQGDFTVTGAKSAAVPLPGGTLGRTYAMECPDSWLADFGEGQLTDGFRRVPIDPKFAATVDLSGRYHVVITPLADAILYVTNRTPESFDVRTSSLWTGDPDARDRDERRGPPPEPIRFTWWVIGRRRDIKGPRFEEVKVPPPPKLP